MLDDQQVNEREKSPTVKLIDQRDMMVLQNKKLRWGMSRQGDVFRVSARNKLSPRKKIIAKEQSSGFYTDASSTAPN